jgi:hypothetical protein
MDEDEKRIMETVERTRKVGDGVAFLKIALLKKKRCRSIQNPGEVFKRLQRKGLLDQIDPGKDLWATTSDGQAIEHYLSKKRLLEDSDLSDIIRR